MSTVLDEALSSPTIDLYDRIYRIRKKVMLMDMVAATILFMGFFLMCIYPAYSGYTYVVLGAAFVYYLLKTVLVSVWLPSFARTFCLILQAGYWVLFPTGIYFKLQSYPFGTELMHLALVISILQLSLQVWLLPEHKSLRIPLATTAVAVSLMMVGLWRYFTVGRNQIF